jgi:uncharacterized protein
MLLGPDSRVRLSPTDLTRFVACEHAAACELKRAAGLLHRTYRNDPAQELLQLRGVRHEQEYLEALQARGLRVCDLKSECAPGKIAAGHLATEAAMREGWDVIYQAPLSLRPWTGVADFLLRVPGRSEFGGWQYELADTKLAHEAKASALIQLCVYAEALSAMQGAPPEHIVVVSPGGVEHRRRAADFAAYVRRLRSDFQQFLDGSAATDPCPVEHCGVCEWWVDCDRTWRDSDDLALVAGLGGEHRTKLRGAGIRTLEALAQATAAPDGLALSDATFERLQRQAAIQASARREGALRAERILPIEPSRGLARLPEPTSFDIFLDFEADRYDPTGTFHYLMGWVDGSGEYSALWANNRDEERENFRTLVNALIRARAEVPALHVYHYGPFEKTALGELMGRYSMLHAEVDDLFRTETLLDLLPVVKQGVRASVEGYSLKELEPFHGFKRCIDLREAARARRIFELGRELGVQDLSAQRQLIQEYNREDCISTRALQAWLERKRTELSARQIIVPRPGIGDDRRAPEKVTEWVVKLEAMTQRLRAGLPEADDDLDEHGRARKLLADLMDWHRREAKPKWWEHFRLRTLSEEELLDEKSAIARLQYVGVVGKDKRSPVHEFRFPAQEVALHEGEEVHDTEGARVGTIVHLDLGSGCVRVKRSKPFEELPSTAFEATDDYESEGFQQALLEFGERLLASASEPLAAFDLLMRRPPRLCDGAPLRGSNETDSEAAVRIATLLDRCVLAIQGPPGSGKTHSGAEMIVALLKGGARVGITGTSHAVISGLLERAVRRATDRGIRVSALQKPKEKGGGVQHPAVQEATGNPAFDRARANGSINLIAGTKYLFVRPELIDAVDVLFIDEAGQFSLADALAISRAGKSVVLLGDPRQLAQPSSGAHPPGAELSALEHLLNGSETIPKELGLFLEETWRLHPDIACFTSAHFYAGRLRAREETRAQRVVGPAPLAGTGLRFIPVKHEGNTNSSAEEAEAIADVLEQLFASSATWVDSKGKERKLEPKDVLVLAPYNAHVRCIQERVPHGVAVGSVDRFQGKEAPIAIYSMATSAAEYAPRGLSFLFSLNRLNVATSRARCVAALVASPSLLRAEAKTERDIRLLNAFCGFLEMATPLRGGPVRLAPP